MILLCFDVDGVLDTAGGPVPFDLLRRLQLRDGARVCIVSPSDNWPKEENMTRVVDGATRADNLRKAAAMHPECLVRLYVDDDASDARRKEAADAGFAFLTAQEFALASAPLPKEIAPPADTVHVTDTVAVEVSPAPPSAPEGRTPS